MFAEWPDLLLFRNVGVGFVEGFERLLDVPHLLLALLEHLGLQLDYRGWLVGSDVDRSRQASRLFLLLLL